jgi:hypothetical protein
LTGGVDETSLNFDKLPQITDSNFYSRLIFQQFNKLFRIGLTVMIGIKIPGTDSQGGISHHFRSHGKRQIHRKKGNLNGEVQNFVLGDVFSVPSDQYMGKEQIIPVKNIILIFIAKDLDG